MIILDIDRNIIIIWTSIDLIYVVYILFREDTRDNKSKFKISYSYYLKYVFDGSDAWIELIGFFSFGLFSIIFGCFAKYIFLYKEIQQKKL